MFIGFLSFPYFHLITFSLLSFCCKNLPSSYFHFPSLQETVMIFLGSLVAAAAVEESNLHQRIALKVLLLFGTSPQWLLLGFMTNTMFLSMWIRYTQLFFHILLFSRFSNSIGLFFCFSLLSCTLFSKPHNFSLILIRLLLSFAELKLE